jgi:hypothetical protein
MHFLYETKIPRLSSVSSGKMIVEYVVNKVSPSFPFIHWQSSCFWTLCTKAIIQSTWAGQVACVEEIRHAYRVLVGTAEGKKPLERPRRRWKDYIKMDLQEVGWDYQDRIDLSFTATAVLPL